MSLVHRLQAPHVSQRLVQTLPIHAAPLQLQCSRLGPASPVGHEGAASAAFRHQLTHVGTARRAVRHGQ